MKRRRLLVVVALLASLQGALLPGDVEAHPSSYCGHQSDGWTIVTKFVRHWNEGRIHRHEYSHERWGGWKIHPNEVKDC